MLKYQGTLTKLINFSPKSIVWRNMALTPSNMGEPGKPRNNWTKEGVEHFSLIKEGLRWIYTVSWSKTKCYDHTRWGIHSLCVWWRIIAWKIKPCPTLFFSHFTQESPPRIYQIQIFIFRQKSFCDTNYGICILQRHTVWLWNFSKC